jgi:hypothetical protein
MAKEATPDGMALLAIGFAEMPAQYLHSSKEIAGRLRLGGLPSEWYRDDSSTERANAIGFSHGDFGLVVLAFHGSRGNHLFRSKIIEDEFQVPA